MGAGRTAGFPLIKPYMPPQITRLVLVTIAIVASYATARALLTPSSFGRYGWYRADALVDATQRPLAYAGGKACEECHEEQVKKVAKFEHKTVGCEACHQAAQAHADNPDQAVHKPADADCLRCHERQAGRPAWLKQIEAPKHYTGQRCIECHVPHQPTEVP